MDAMGLPPEEETAVTMSSLTDYFKTTAERVKLDDLKEQALRNAYIFRFRCAVYLLGRPDPDRGYTRTKAALRPLRRHRL